MNDAANTPDRASPAAAAGVDRRWKCLALWLAFIVAILLLIALYAAVRFLPNYPIVDYGNTPEDHFKYGTTGGEQTVGLPFEIWRALPQVCSRHLPKDMPAPEERPYEAFGMIYEKGREVPVGMSRRRHLGIDRVWLNCSGCHVGTLRESPASEPRLYVGMPGNSLNLGAFQRFFFACAVDRRFSTEYIVPEIDRLLAKQDDKLGPIDRYVVYPLAIWLTRDRLLSLRERFAWAEREPAMGPGRVETFNPGKAGYFYFPMDKLPAAEVQAPVDLPSVWNQGMKRGMHLHWDGNNGNVVERNKNAAFATGATPPTIDLNSVARMEAYLREAKQPKYPWRIDEAKAAQGAQTYQEYCAGCHGVDGHAFAPKDGVAEPVCLTPGESDDIYGPTVGLITRIEEIGTDRKRLDSFSVALASNMGTPYAGTPYRFCNYRKTFGYANMPLDGLWLRAPYLHNGSVPTLRDLLDASDQRPATFYRGNDVYDPVKVGFVSSVAAEGARRYFLFDTSIYGNGNRGHEGHAYGTELSDEEKDALVEHLKTF
jgi:Cytochrome C oxidase, cbb3-type, subunit III